MEARLQGTRSRQAFRAERFVELSDEVRVALDRHEPIVAVETAALAHGMPYPANRDLASELTGVVRDGGALLALVGVSRGRVRVGLSESEIDRLCSASSVRKISSRDIGVALVSGEEGATTLASTVAIAGTVGIRVVAGGGMGGVHRGASETFDVSADLVQLTRSRVVVVCSGAKNVLDIGLTLEYLETLAVPVLGYRCDEFPGYYCRSSGFMNPHRVDSVSAIVEAVRAYWSLQVAAGVIVTTPVPEDEALSEAEVNRALDGAVAQAKRSGIRGAALTPYLMRTVAQATAGRTGRVNAAIIRETASLAASISAGLAGSA